VTAPAAAIDPNCETLDAYAGRVRSAIGRFFEYSPQAREARLQGDVMVHFFSDSGGRIVESTITASSVDRVYPDRREGGRHENLIVGFTRTGADSWTWQARMHLDPGPDVMLGNGSVTAGNDGMLRAPGRSDGMMVLELPPSVPGNVPRLILPFGRAAELALLEKSVRHTLDLAQPLPKIPSCLKQQTLDATMPFRFHQQGPR